MVHGGSNQSLQVQSDFRMARCARGFGLQTFSSRELAPYSATTSTNHGREMLNMHFRTDKNASACEMSRKETT